MLTLTQTAFYTRLAIKSLIIFIILVVVGKIFVGTGIKLYLQAFPPPPPPPTHIFGKLPALYFPERQGLPNFSFTLQTATGDLPKLPTTSNVYFMPQRSSSFLSLDEATKIAKSLNFQNEGVSLSETIYRFSHKDVPSILDVNIINKTLSISYNLSKSPDLLSLHPTSSDEALRTVSSYLSQSNLLTPDLQNGEKTFEYLQAKQQDLETVGSLSEANFIRVNLFRQKIDDMPLLTQNRKRANVWFLISGDRSYGKQIIAGEYHYFPVDTTRKSTYPIKTAQEAWGELTAGKAYIAQLPENTGNKVTIRRVYLAYYDAKQPQGFLQPVVAFDGDGGFAAYVPAITSEYYQDQSAKQEPLETTLPAKK